MISGARRGKTGNAGAAYLWAGFFRNKIGQG
jgi:hypothetical protein